MTQTPANAEQLEYWNGPVGERWAGLQEKIDQNLAAITEALFKFANPIAGEQVLDLGCGCGTTSFMLEKLVGPAGTVTGIDISKPMLEVARSRAGALKSKVNFVEADASTHDFGETRFSLVFSRFGVMFFDYPVAAFAHVKRALVPAGRVAFVCWRAFKENDWSYVPYQAALALLPAQEPADPQAPGPFAFANAGRVKTILLRAGFKDAAIEKLDSRMYMGRTVQSAAEEALNIGPLARAARELPEDVRAKIRAAAEIAYRPYESKDGVAPPAAAWLVRAGV